MAVLLLLLTALTGEADSPPDSANPQELACGPSSLSVAARLLGREVSPSELAGVTEGGLDRIYSLEELRVAAGRLGFETMPARCSPEFLTRVDAPMIVAVDGTNSNPDGAHFVVLFGADAKQVQLIDYPRPPQLVSYQTLGRHWDGRGLFITNTPKELAVLEAEFGPRVPWESWAASVVLAASVVALGMGWCRSKRTDAAS